jgi:integrase
MEKNINNIDIYPSGVYTLIGGLSMLGSIGTKQRCSKCGGFFSERDRHGLYCPIHETRPTLYYVRATAFGFKNPLYRTPMGKSLDHYDKADALLSSIRLKWDECIKSGNKFNINDFIHTKVALLKFEAKAEAFLKTKDNLYLREKPKLSKSEWQGIHNRFKKFINPFFEGKDIRDLTDEDMQAFYDYLLGLRMPDGTSYSDKHIKDIMVNVKSLFIFSRLDIPDFPKGWNTVEPKKNKRRMNIETQMKIAPHIPDKHGYRLAMNIFTYAPMRPCELRALTINDITDRGVIVSKSLTDRLKFTRKSNPKPHPYALPDYVMDDLRKHVTGKDRDDFIFTVRGNPYTEGTLRRMWKRVLIKAGIPHIELYQAIRHSWASQEWEQSQLETLERIQDKLSHTNKQTGQKHYIIKK